jgi:hypothetical protein
MYRENPEKKRKEFSKLPLGLTFVDGLHQISEKLGSPSEVNNRDDGEVESAKWVIGDLVMHADFRQERPIVGMFTLMAQEVVPV